MTKLGLIIRQEAEKYVKEKLKEAESFLLVRYSGISSSDLNQLRNALSNVGSCFLVIKNCISKRVFKSNQDLHPLIEGPSGLIFVNKDLISTSKIIYEFIKVKPSLEIRAGFLKERLLTGKEIEVIAKIPSLPALKSQVALGLKAPITGLAFSLKHILNKLVWTLGQIKNKK